VEIVPLPSFKPPCQAAEALRFTEYLLILRSMPIAYIFLWIMKTHLVTALCLLLSLSACTAPTSGNDAAVATGAGAQKFMDDVNETLLKLGIEGSQAGWVSETHITDDTSALNARANQRLIDATARFSKESVKFDKLDLAPDLRRELNLLKVSLVMATPSNPKEGEELTKIAANLDAAYGKGKWCPDPKKPETCLDINKITDIMRESRDPKKLREVWEGWHTISPPMRKDYVRFVELSNEGAKELGFADTGAMWRSKYDMPPDAYAKELDRLWDEMKPLYLALHAYVRAKLRAAYGDAVPASGPIPAHLLGDMWAQTWNNVYPLVKPADGDPGFDLDEILKQRKADEKEMVRYGERFFTSLG